MNWKLLLIANSFHLLQLTSIRKSAISSILEHDLPAVAFLVGTSALIRKEYLNLNH